MAARTPTPLHADIAALERTALAWERTALGVAAIGTLLVKAPSAGPLAEVFGVVLLAVGIGLILLAPIGYSRTRRDLVAAGPRDLEVFSDPVARWRHRVILGTVVALSLAASAVAVEVVLDAARDL
ncbi:hypothetical protein GCM10027425_18840 [Alteromonas gracilis]